MTNSLSNPDAMVAYAPGASHEMHQTATQFRRELLNLLQQNGDQAVLYGSWYTDEAHLPPPVKGWVFSHSDVDIAYSGSLKGGGAHALKEGIEALARRCRLSLARVSVRSTVLMENLPHLAAHTSARKALPRVLPTDPSSELIFWTSVSGLEALLTIQDSQRRRLSGESYAAAKLLLTLLRNIAMIHGEEARAHRDVVRWHEVHTTALSARSALHVKTGAMALSSNAATASFLSPERLGSLLGNLCPRTGVREVARVIEICEQQIAGRLPLECRALLAAARGVATDSIARAVLDHQTRKLVAAGFRVD